MKKDWSIFRITILLYAIVLLLPLSYYFAKQSFDNMQGDSITMNRLVFINGTIQRVIRMEDTKDRNDLVNEVEVSLSRVTQELLELDYAVQPTKYWTVDGKNLRDIWRETYVDGEM